MTSLRFLLTFLIKNSKFPAFFLVPFFFFLDLVLLFFLFLFLFSFFFRNVFSFLAFVSGFNKRCFLHSRCSMETWCPDDIGRDCWDWVGPPAWGRARFNSPEWGGGSSPLKTEPPQIVLLLLLFRTHMKVCVCAHHLKPACNYELIRTESVQTWRRGPAQNPGNYPTPVLT